jgi:TatD DNase family protein
MEWFDTHAHLDDEQFHTILDDVITRAAQSSVSRIVTVGTSASSSRACVELSSKHPMVFAAVGIHPNYCAQAEGNDWDEIITLATCDRVVALGETGLDRHWDYSPLPQQQDYFDRHIRLSQKTGLPFVVHMRESLSEIMAMLREARARGPLSGVMHSYVGDVDAAHECIELGMYVSFAGMVTFKKSADLRTVAANVPDDRILVETDAPYLSPEPRRGHRPNEPSFLRHTAECIAALRRVSLDRFAAQTSQNALRLFNRAT